jgi:hypothetical protein
MHPISEYCGRYWCEALTCALFTMVAAVIGAPVI